MATTSKRLVLLAALLLAAPLSAQPVVGGTLPGPLPLFPADNWWNVDVSAAPADAALTTFYLAFIGNDPIHPDFGGDADPAPFIYGMPYIVVPGDQPSSPWSSTTPARAITERRGARSATRSPSRPRRRRTGSRGLRRERRLRR